MADIFQEVDEEVRREQLKKLWQGYGNYIAAACIIVVVAVGGWRGYEWWQGKKAAESGAAFEQAVALAASKLRSAITGIPPSAAKRSAISLPMPLAAPVTIATFLSKRAM